MFFSPNTCTCNWWLAYFIFASSSSTKFVLGLFFKYILKLIWGGACPNSCTRAWSFLAYVHRAWGFFVNVHRAWGSAVHRAHRILLYVHRAQACLFFKCVNYVHRAWRFLLTCIVHGPPMPALLNVKCHVFFFETLLKLHAVSGMKYISTINSNLLARRQQNFPTPF